MFLHFLSHILHDTFPTTSATAQPGGILQIIQPGQLKRFVKYDAQNHQEIPWFIQNYGFFFFYTYIYIYYVCVYCNDI